MVMPGARLPALLVPGQTLLPTPEAVAVAGLVPPPLAAQGLAYAAGPSSGGKGKRPAGKDAPGAPAAHFPGGATPPQVATPLLVSLPIAQALRQPGHTGQQQPGALQGAPAEASSRDGLDGATSPTTPPQARLPVAAALAAAPPPPQQQQQVAGGASAGVIGGVLAGAAMHPLQRQGSGFATRGIRGGAGPQGPPASTPGSTQARAGHQASSPTASARRGRAEGTFAQQQQQQQPMPHSSQARHGGGRSGPQQQQQQQHSLQHHSLMPQQQHAMQAYGGGQAGYAPVASLAGGQTGAFPYAAFPQHALAAMPGAYQIAPGAFAYAPYAAAPFSFAYGAPYAAYDGAGVGAGQRSQSSGQPAAGSGPVQGALSFQPAAYSPAGFSPAAYAATPEAAAAYAAALAQAQAQAQSQAEGLPPGASIVYGAGPEPYPIVAYQAVAPAAVASATAEAPIPGWQTLRDPSGRLYYADASGKTQWERPVVEG